MTFSSQSGRLSVTSGSRSQSVVWEVGWGGVGWGGVGWGGVGWGGVGWGGVGWGGWGVGGGGGGGCVCVCGGGDQQGAGGLIVQRAARAWRASVRRHTNFRVWHIRRRAGQGGESGRGSAHRTLNTLREHSLSRPFSVKYSCLQVQAPAGRREAAATGRACGAPTRRCSLAQPTAWLITAADPTTPLQYPRHPSTNAALAW